MITDVIIMAGGFGERLWPASSALFPKQFMALDGENSFMQTSILRALSVRPSGKILIVTRKDIEDECCKQVNDLASRLSKEDGEKLLSDCVVISEPCGRHTSAAILTGLYFVKKTSAEKKHTFLVLTSDHVIGPTELFASDCQSAAKAAEDGKFVCFAIPPTEPATGFGYIKAGKDLYSDEKVFEIDNFKEKPSLEIAKIYISDGNYWWNSGMFAFTADFLENEMEKCTHSVYEAFAPVKNGNAPTLSKDDSISVLSSWPELEETYKNVPEIAIDKSIAEKTKSAACVKAHFNWTDVGSWETFSELSTGSAKETSADIDGKGNFIYSDLPVALCGVENLIVVVKNGKVLVMKRGCGQLVREAVKKLEK